MHIGFSVDFRDCWCNVVTCFVHYVFVVISAILGCVSALSYVFCCGGLLVL